MSESQPEEEHRFWQVEAVLFQHPMKPRRIDWLMDRLRPLGSLLLIALAVSYPLILVYLGIAYGGLAFWGSLAGSMAIIYLIVSRLGFERNFEGRGSPILKGLMALTLGFGVALSIYLSLFNLRILTIPIAIGILSLGLVYFLRK